MKEKVIVNMRDCKYQREQEQQGKRNQEAATISDINRGGSESRKGTQGQECG